jgi:hypothetical protein
VKKLNLVVGVGLGVMVAGVCLEYGRWWDPAARSKHAGLRSEHGTSEELRAEIERLRAEVGNLTNGQARLGERLRAVNAAAPPSRAAAGDRQSEAPPDPPQMPSQEELEARAQRKIQTMEAKFASEPVDAQWAKGAANDIRDKINLSEASVSDVNCATTLCRFSISSKSGDRTMNDLDEALKQRPWEGTAFFYIDEKDPTKANVYLARAGAELPRFD